MISCDLVTGFCINDAHTVTDLSSEAFILRIWRKKNKVGWVKAMSEEAGTFTSTRGRGGAAFGGLEVAMKALFLRKVWLYPRFTISVKESLTASDAVSDEEDEEDDEEIDTRIMKPIRHQLDVVELHQSFTELATSIQNALVEVIDTLITQLKSENKHLTVYDTPSSSQGVAPANVTRSDAATSRAVQSLNLSIEAGLMKNFETILRQELDPIHHRLSAKTKAILSDMHSLRTCLSHLIHHDCVTFHRFLLAIKKNAVNGSGGASTWLFSDSAERLFKLAKQRVYQVIPGVPQVNPRSNRAKVQSAKKPTTTTGSGTSKNDAMELSDGEDEVFKAKPSSSSSEDLLHLVLEENPKWSLLVDTIEEIETQVCERAKEFEYADKRREAGEIMRGDVSNEKDASSSSSSSSVHASSLPSSFGRTLILVRDSRTAALSTRLLTVGGRNYLRAQWKKYLFATKVHQRTFVTNPTGSHVKGQPPPPPVSSTFLQLQRESQLLKRELEDILAADMYERFIDQEEWRQTERSQKAKEEAKRADQKKAEEEVGFDLRDDQQMTLTQLTKHEKAKAAAENEKRKLAKLQPKTNTTPSSSPTKPAFNPYRSHKRDQLLESIDREDASIVEEASSTSATVPPQLQFEPRTNANQSSNKGKRHQSSEQNDTANGPRKKHKSNDKESEKGKDDSGDMDRDDDLNDSSSRRRDELDDDESMLIEQEKLADFEEQAHAAAASGNFNPSSAVRPGGVGSTSAVLQFDRSDFSVVDANFKMDSLPAQTSSAVPSPHFPISDRSHAASSSISSIKAAAAAHLSSSTTVTVLPSFQLMVHPIENLHTILHQYEPEYVIIYDPDILCIRELEVFQSLPTTTWQIRVYFLLYSNSIEEQRYLTSIEQENKAFEHLIQTKKNMVVPIEQDGKVPEPTVHQPSAADRKNSHLYDDGIRNSTYEAYAATLPNSVDTRRGGAVAEGPGTILVDTREFRSSLPSLLHAAGVTVQPLTLLIGDYILTPTLSIERKSVPDLIGSLNSGRLYNQMEQTLRYYKTPVLLIEFDRSRPFMLLSKSDLSSDISPKSVLSKLSLLILHFPQMRILWSRDSYATANLFTALKQKQSQPSAEQAVTTNQKALTSAQAGYEFIDVSAGVGMTEEEKEAKNLSLTPHDILRKLPGVNSTNIRHILQNVNNLRELCECSIADFNKWMGPQNAKKLYSFLHGQLRLRTQIGKARRERAPHCCALFDLLVFSR